MKKKTKKQDKQILSLLFKIKKPQTKKGKQNEKEKPSNKKNAYWKTD